MESVQFIFSPENRGYAIPSDQEIYPLVAISEFLMKQGFVFCRASTGGGISEIMHTGDAPYNVVYRDLYKFRDDFVNDFFKTQKEEEKRSGGWISSLNYGHVDVYLKKGELLFSAGTHCGGVSVSWHGYSEQHMEFIECVNDEMQNILGKCRRVERQSCTFPKAMSSCWA